MKTTKEWLESLPEPINHLALEACDHDLLNSFADSASLSIRSMCLWYKSELGIEFWYGVYEELLHNESAT